MSNVQIDDSNSTSTYQYQQTPPRLLSGRYPRGMQQNAYELMIYRWPDPRDDMDPDTAYRINQRLVNKIHKKIKKNYKTQEIQKNIIKNTRKPKNKINQSPILFWVSTFSPFKNYEKFLFFSSDHFVKGPPSYIFDHHRTTVHVNP